MSYIIMAIVSITIVYLVLKYSVTKKINTIFRHDLFNDLQLVDGYLTLKKPEKSKEYLTAAFEKKEVYSILDKSNLIMKICYLLLYNKIHRKTSNFKIYINENILENMFFSLYFVKTIVKVYKDSVLSNSNSITVEIEKDCIEIITPQGVKSYII